jgi:hypothetical protein
MEMSFDLYFIAAPSSTVPLGNLGDASVELTGSGLTFDISINDWRAASAEISICCPGDAIQFYKPTVHK